MEDSMFHLTHAMLLAGAFVFILGVRFVVKAFLEYRRGKVPPFRDYFGSEYDRDLLRQSAFSESEDWRADRQERSIPFRLRDPGTSEHRARVGGTTQGYRCSN
jgi:hypothetical protein